MKLNIESICLSYFQFWASLKLFHYPRFASEICDKRTFCLRHQTFNGTFRKIWLMVSYTIHLLELLENLKSKSIILCNRKKVLLSPAVVNGQSHVLKYLSLSIANIWKIMSNSIAWDLNSSLNIVKQVTLQGDVFYSDWKKD